MSLVLTLTDIWKSYNGKPVLRDCSYSFAEGIYVLMGPNGSGKSTFLRICALLESPDKGKINYFAEDGSPIKDGIELKRNITLVLPEVGIFNTTVFKNVAYGLKIRGEEREKIEEKVSKALDFVSLGHKKNHNALTLSSGETQRLGIARAMVIEPEVLFLDEPTASVDEENTEIIERIILDMEKNDMSTIIITTHDTAQAGRLGGRILLMQDGRIIDKN